MACFMEIKGFACFHLWSIHSPNIFRQLWILSCSNWAKLLAQSHEIWRTEHRTQPFSQSPTPCDTWHGDAQMLRKFVCFVSYVATCPLSWPKSLIVIGLGFVFPSSPKLTDIGIWRHPGRLNRIHELLKCFTASLWFHSPKPVCWQHQAEAWNPCWEGLLVGPLHLDH